MSAIENVHGAYVVDRRVRVLADRLAALLPEGAEVLDVGAGDGRLGRRLLSLRRDIRYRGIDVLVREDIGVEVSAFDGRTLPFDAESHDAVLFVDVLHHCEDQPQLLAEAARVTRRHVLIKDHDPSGLFARATLRFMDRVGNQRHGVALPYDYWRLERWREEWVRAGLELETLVTRLGLYPFPASLLFDRRLHFIARLCLEGRD